MWMSKVDKYLITRFDYIYYSVNTTHMTSHANIENICNIGRHQPSHRSRVFSAVMLPHTHLIYVLMYNYYINNNLNHYLNCFDRARTGTSHRTEMLYSACIITRARLCRRTSASCISGRLLRLCLSAMFIAVFSYGNICDNQIQ